MKKYTHTTHIQGTHTSHTCRHLHTPTGWAAGCTQFSHERAARAPFERKPEIKFGARLLFMRFYCAPKAERRAAAATAAAMAATTHSMPKISEHNSRRGRGRGRQWAGRCYILFRTYFSALAAFYLFSMRFCASLRVCCRCRGRSGCTQWELHVLAQRLMFYASRVAVRSSSSSGSFKTNTNPYRV